MTKKMLHQEWNAGIDEAIEMEAQAQAILHADQGFPPRLRGVRGEAEADISKATDGSLRALRLAVLRGAAREARARGRSLGAGEPRATRTARMPTRSAGAWCRTSGCAGYLSHCARPRRPTCARSPLLREVLRLPRRARRFRVRHAGPGQRADRARRHAEREEEVPRRSRGGGEAIAAFALSEPDAGSDVAGDDHERARERRRLGARRRPRPGSRTAASPTSTSCSRKADEGISAFVVDAKDVDASERIDIVAPHPMATLKLKGATARRCWARPAQGFKLAMRNLDIFRTTVAAAALGFARRALDEALRTCARAQDVRPDARRLPDDAGEARRHGDRDRRRRAARPTARPGRATCRKQRVTREAAMAKMFATEAAQQVIDDAVQICGGLASMRGHPVERLYREVRALRIYEGATEVQKIIIARDLLKCMSYTAHIDTFARDNLPPRSAVAGVPVRAAGAASIRRA